MLNSRRNFLKKFNSKKETSVLLNLQQDDPNFNKFSKKVGGRVANTKANGRRNPITSGLARYTGPFTELEASHLLRRTQYGVKPSELEAALGKTMSQVVDELFSFNPIISSPSSGPLNNYQNNTSVPPILDTNGLLLGDDWTKSTFGISNAQNPNIASLREISLKHWRWGVYFNDGNTLREKLTDFWSHFIPIDIDDVRKNLGTNSPIFCHDYFQMLRDNCNGNFRTIIEQVSKSNAMLGYLSGQFSTKTIPNENFARELLELFTIGKDDIQENNSYTEDDIKATSKIFSGWRMNNTQSITYPVPVVFNPNFHNQEDKSFSVNFDYTIIPNQTGANGANEFDLFFNMLFEKQKIKISQYIIERLYRYFVYYEIDSFTRANVIVPLARSFRDGNWEIQPVLKRLLKSEHFYDINNIGVMIKSPFDFITGLVRGLQINTVKADGNVIDQYNCYKYFNTISLEIDQGSGVYPTVSGYKAYYQKPTYYQNWINSNNLQKRDAFINKMLSYTIQGNIKLQIDVVAYVKLFPLATQQTPDLLIDTCIKYLLPKDIDITFKNDVLKKTSLLNNQGSDTYWTDAWNAHLAAPSDASKLKIVTDRLKAMFTTLLKLAEYQLM
jgi:uncharacterized protein (DUF1800 family)